MLALVIAIEPVDGVSRDFGSVAVAVTGADTCGRRNGSAKDYVDEVVRDVKERMFVTLREG